MKFSQFLKNNPNLTLFGLAWSMYWRMALIIGGIYFVIGIISAM